MSAIVGFMRKGNDRSGGYKYTDIGRILKPIRLIAAVILVFILSNAPIDALFAQVSEEWAVSYTGSSITPVAMAVDGNGNTYMVGSGFTSGRGYDYVIVKFNSQGIRDWDKKFNGPSNNNDYASGITLDTDGNVYVIGTISSGSGNSTYDFATVKYNGSGEELWSAIFSGDGNGFDKPTTVIVDGSGNIYVTGISARINGSTDFVTIKYDSAGEELWKSFYNGPASSTDEAHAIALDDQNNVYVTGRSRSGAFTSSTDFATIKYNSSGQEQWVARYNGASDEFDAAVSVAVDGSGNVYVTGISTGTGHDYTTVKYNSAGAELWAKRYNGPGNSDDRPVKIVLDGQGNIYVTGQSRQTSSLNSEDYATIKYNSSGDELWVRSFDGDASSVDVASDMVIDDANNIYVTGYSETGSGAVTKDIYTIKYKSDGSVDWSVFYDNSENTGDEPVGIGLDNSGGVYVAGSSKLAFLALKYGQPTDVKEIPSSVPDSYSLNQNFPNPFNPSTVIGWEIASDTRVLLKVYDIVGREVATLVDKIQHPGKYEMIFDATGLPSGVYIYRLETDGFVTAKNMILTK
jgi:uncharacterized delta-60 repeat protein